MDISYQCCKYGKYFAEGNNPCTTAITPIIFITIATAIDSGNNKYDHCLTVIKPTELESKLSEYYHTMVYYMIIMAVILLVCVIIANIMLEFNVRMDCIMLGIGLYDLSNELSLFYDCIFNSCLLTVLIQFVGSYFVCKLCFYSLFVYLFLNLFLFCIVTVMIVTIVITSD